MTRLSGKTSDIVAVLDIGTAKTVCIAAARRAARSGVGAAAPSEAPLRILGIGHQQSRGVKAGAIIDLAEAESCIRATIAQAERMAGVTLESVFVSVSCGRLKSHNMTASADLAGGTVSARDVARLMSGARAYIERDGRRLVHLNRRAVHLDGTLCEGDLTNMAARHMSSAIHAVSADEAPVRNLMAVLERCHVGVAGWVVAPFASALAVTSEEDRQLGVTVIDIGCGTTKLATFSAGQLEFVRSVPLGSGLMTSDISRALHTPLIEAERIKVLYGNLLSARSDEHEGFSYPQAGMEEGLLQRATKAELASVLRSRAAEILQAVAFQPDGRRFAGGAGEAILLTGGGSLLTGMAEFASDVLQRPVRRGQAVEVSGLPPVARTLAFSTVTGLLFARDSLTGQPVGNADLGDDHSGGYMHRVGSWLKGGF